MIEFDCTISCDGYRQRERFRQTTIEKDNTRDKMLRDLIEKLEIGHFDLAEVIQELKEIRKL